MIIQLNFNSIKVRLERYMLTLCAVPLRSFQFHKGAIRTYSSFVPTTSDIGFQFHKGAIRTLEADLLEANLSISIP